MLKNLFIVVIFSLNISSSTLMSPTSQSTDLYDGIILDGTYTDTIKVPSTYLGFNIGERVASPSQISNAILSWATQSNRMIVKEYAKSHEGELVKYLHAVIFKFKSFR